MKVTPKHLSQKRKRNTLSGLPLFYNAVTTLGQVQQKVIQLREYNATISTKEKKYLIFSHQPSQSFFKKLSIGTNLGKALTRMSEDKAFPKGL